MNCHSLFWALLLRMVKQEMLLSIWFHFQQRVQSTASGIGCIMRNSFSILAVTIFVRKFDSNVSTTSTIVLKKGNQQQSVVQMGKQQQQKSIIVHWNRSSQLTVAKCNAHNCNSLYPIIRLLNNDNPSIVGWLNAGLWCCLLHIYETANRECQALESIGAIKSKTVYYYGFARTRYFSAGEQQRKNKARIKRATFFVWKTF